MLRPAEAGGFELFVMKLYNISTLANADIFAK